MSRIRHVNLMDFIEGGDSGIPSAVSSRAI